MKRIKYVTIDSVFLKDNKMTGWYFWPTKHSKGFFLRDTNQDKFYEIMSLLNKNGFHGCGYNPGGFFCSYSGPDDRMWQVYTLEQAQELVTLFNLGASNNKYLVKTIEEKE